MRTAWQGRTDCREPGPRSPGNEGHGETVRQTFRARKPARPLGNCRGPYPLKTRTRKPSAPEGLLHLFSRNQTEAVSLVSAPVKVGDLAKRRGAPGQDLGVWIFLRIILAHRRGAPLAPFLACDRARLPPVARNNSARWLEEPRESWRSHDKKALNACVTHDLRHPLAALGLNGGAGIIGTPPEST